MAEQAWRRRPCVTRRGGPGRPGFPSALKTKGCLRKKAGTVRMKGGESRPDHGDENPRFGPDETVPGWKTPQWSAGRRRASQGTRAPSPRCQTKMVRQSALRSLTCVRGKGNDGGPRADQIMGTMNHVCMAERNLKTESEMERTLASLPRNRSLGFLHHILRRGV